MSIARKSLIFSSATFISRIGGLVRDVTLAAVFGTGRSLDAYFISIVFPFFFRKVFGEGAMASSFVPHYRTSKDRDVFVSSVVNSLGLVTISIALLAQFFPGIVAKIFAPGYPQNILAEIEKLVRVSSLFIPIVFIWAVFYSILNSHNVYFLPALSPLFMNIGVITGVLIGKTPFWGVFGFVSGGAVASLSLYVKARKFFKYRFTFKGFSRYAPDFLKATGAVMANQLNLLVDTMVASFLGAGAVSSIQLASRLFQLPMGLFVVAVSTVSLVELTERDARREALSSAVFLSLPSGVGLFLLSDGITNLVYSFGNLSPKACKIISEVLRMYAPGVVFYSIYSVALRFHHSRKKMNVPLVASSLVSLTNAALDIPLGLKMGPSGIALATSVAGLIGVLFFAFRRELIFDWNELSKIFIASAIVGALLIFFQAEGKFLTLILITLSIVVYFLILKLLGSRTLKEIIRR